MYIKYTLITIGVFKPCLSHSFLKTLPLNRVLQVSLCFKLVHVGWRLKCGEQKIYHNFSLKYFFFNVDKTFQCRISLNRHYSIHLIEIN